MRGAPPALVLLLLATACASPSLRVVVTADPDVLELSDRISVEVTRSGAIVASVSGSLRSGEPDELAFPLTLDVASDPGPFGVVVDMLDTSRASVVRRRAEGTLTGPLVLDVHLEASCVLERCDDVTTCRVGSCGPPCVEDDGSGMAVPVDCPAP